MTTDNNNANAPDAPVVETVEADGMVIDTVKVPAAVPEEVRLRYRGYKVAAGRKGGGSRSAAKSAASKANLAKARAKRWKRHQLMAVTPEQSNRPSGQTT